MFPLAATAPVPALALHDLPVPGGRISFEAHAGDLVLLRGATPEAQWRLLAIAAGHAFGGPGRCLIDGQDTRPLDRHTLAALRLRSTARVLARDQLRAAGNLLTVTAQAAVERGVPPPVAVHRAADELARIGLGSRLDASAASLSPAEQRLVLLARAKACRPCLLVVERADDGMDAAERSQLRGALADAAQQGSCVLMSAEHPSFAAIATRHLHIGPAMAHAA